MTFPWNSGKTESYETPQEQQHHLDNKLCLFVTPLETLPRTVQNPPWFPQSLSVQDWPGQVHVFWHRLEKRLSSPWDSTWPKECVELPCVKILTLNASVRATLQWSHSRIEVHWDRWAEGDMDSQVHWHNGYPQRSSWGEPTESDTLYSWSFGYPQAESIA